MDWIERWFGISPDNGDGSLEMLYLVALAVSAGLLFVACHRPTRRALNEWLRPRRAPRANRL